MYDGPRRMEDGKLHYWWDDASYAAYQAWDPYADYDAADFLPWRQRMTYRFCSRIWLITHPKFRAHTERRIRDIIAFRSFRQPPF